MPCARFPRHFQPVSRASGKETAAGPRGHKHALGNPRSRSPRAKGRQPGPVGPALVPAHARGGAHELGRSVRLRRTWSGRALRTSGSAAAVGRSSPPISRPGFSIACTKGSSMAARRWIICEMNPSPAARVALAAVRRWGRPAVDLERAVALTHRAEAECLRRNVGTLRRIAALAPLVGLLGTLLAIGRILAAIPGPRGPRHRPPDCCRSGSAGMGAGTGPGDLSLDFGTHHRDACPGGLRLAGYPDRTAFWSTRPSGGRDHRRDRDGHAASGT